MDITNVYVLQLKEGKYYIGKTYDIEKRFEEHLAGEGLGSAWTRKYEPLSIEKTILNASPFEEDKVTKEYMLRYGIENVRGGSYVTELLTNEQIANIKKEIWAATDKCTRCGRNNHFVADCYAATTIDGDKIENVVWICDNCDKEFPTEALAEQHERTCKKKKGRTVVCYKCGKAGHYASKCYSRK